MKVPLELSGQPTSFDLTKRPRRAPVSYQALADAFDCAASMHANVAEKALAWMKQHLRGPMDERFRVGWGGRLETQVRRFVPVVVAAGGGLGEALDQIVTTRVLRKIKGRHNNIEEDLDHLLGILEKTWRDKLREPVAALWTHEGCLDLRVSKESLDRAIRILAGLISIVEDAGFSVAVETREHRAQTFAKICGEEIRFGLVEKINRIDLTSPPQGGMLERILKYGGRPVTEQPSGKLSITVWTSWGSDRRRWSDGKRPLEEQLPHVVAGLIRLALIDRAKERERVAEERERQRRAEEWAKLEAAVKEEKSKIRALEEAGAKWNRAEQIRSFVAAARSAAVQNGQAAEPGTQFGDWITWAELQADRLDPLKESPPSIIDRIPDSETESTGYSGYGQEPEQPFRLPKPIWRTV